MSETVTLFHARDSADDTFKKGKKRPYQRLSPRGIALDKDVDEDEFPVAPTRRRPPDKASKRLPVDADRSKNVVADPSSKVVVQEWLKSDPDGFSGSAADAHGKVSELTQFLASHEDKIDSDRRTQLEEVLDVWRQRADTLTREQAAAGGLQAQDAGQADTSGEVQPDSVEGDGTRAGYTEALRRNSDFQAATNAPSLVGLDAEKVSSAPLISPELEQEQIAQHLLEIAQEEADISKEVDRLKQQLADHKSHVNDVLLKVGLHGRKVSGNHNEEEASLREQLEVRLSSLQQLQVEKSDLENRKRELQEFASSHTLADTGEHNGAGVFEREFGLTVEQLKTIEGFEDLSLPQQALVLENFRQLTLGRIREGAEDVYDAEMRQSTSFWSKAGLAKLWKGFSKAYQIAEKERVTAAQLRSGDIELHRQTLELLVKNAADPQALRVEFGADGKTVQLDFLNVSGLEFFHEGAQEKLQHFQEAANQLARIPQEWSYPEASAADREKYHAARTSFRQAKLELMDLLFSHSDEADGLMRAGESEEFLGRLNDAEYQIEMQRFVNKYPDAENALVELANQSTITRLLKNGWRLAGDTARSFTAGKFNENAAHLTFGFGLAGRSIAAGIWLAALPVASGFFGGVNGWQRAKENLVKQDKQQRDKGGSPELLALKEKMLRNRGAAKEILDELVKFEKRGVRNRTRVSDGGPEEVAVTFDDPKDQQVYLEKRGQLQRLREELDILKVQYEKKGAKNVLKSYRAEERLEELLELYQSLTRPDALVDLTGEEATKHQKKIQQVRAQLRTRVDYTKKKLEDGHISFDGATVDETEKWEGADPRAIRMWQQQQLLTMLSRAEVYAAQKGDQKFHLTYQLRDNNEEPFWSAQGEEWQERSGRRLKAQLDRHKQKIEDARLEYKKELAAKGALMAAGFSLAGVTIREAIAEGFFDSIAEHISPLQEKLKEVLPAGLTVSGGNHSGRLHSRFAHAFDNKPLFMRPQGSLANELQETLSTTPKVSPATSVPEPSFQTPASSMSAPEGVLWATDGHSPLSGAMSQSEDFPFDITPSAENISSTSLPQTSVAETFAAAGQSVPPEVSGGGVTAEALASNPNVIRVKVPPITDLRHVSGTSIEGQAIKLLRKTKPDLSLAEAGRDVHVAVLDFAREHHLTASQLHSLNHIRQADLDMQVVDGKLKIVSLDTLPTRGHEAIHISRAVLPETPGAVAPETPAEFVTGSQDVVAGVAGVDDTIAQVVDSSVGIVPETVAPEQLLNDFALGNSAAVSEGVAQQAGETVAQSSVLPGAEAVPSFESAGDVTTGLPDMASANDLVQEELVRNVEAGIDHTAGQIVKEVMSSQEVQKGLMKEFLNTVFDASGMENRADFIQALQETPSTDNQALEEIFGQGFHTALVSLEAALVGAGLGHAANLQLRRKKSVARVMADAAAAVAQEADPEKRKQGLNAFGKFVKAMKWGRPKPTSEASGGSTAPKEASGQKPSSKSKAATPKRGPKLASEKLKEEKEKKRAREAERSANRTERDRKKRAREAAQAQARNPEK